MTVSTKFCRDFPSSIISSRIHLFLLVNQSVCALHNSQMKKLENPIVRNYCEIELKTENTVSLQDNIHDTNYS